MSHLNGITKNLKHSEICKSSYKITFFTRSYIFTITELKKKLFVKNFFPISRAGSGSVIFDEIYSFEEITAFR